MIESKAIEHRRYAKKIPGFVDWPLTAFHRN
jgi:hypothetical protein